MKNKFVCILLPVILAGTLSLTALAASKSFVQWKINAEISKSIEETIQTTETTEDSAEATEELESFESYVIEDNEEEGVMYSAAELIVRSGAGLDYEEVSRLEVGQKVYVLEDEDDIWVRIWTGEVDGWCNKTYLIETDISDVLAVQAD